VTQVATIAYLIKELDGSYKMSTTLPEGLKPIAKASVQDIKIGCREILEVIERNTLADAVVSKLVAITQTESQKTASSIREALVERDIL